MNQVTGQFDVCCRRPQGQPGNIIQTPSSPVTGSSILPKLPATTSQQGAVSSPTSQFSPSNTVSQQFPPTTQTTCPVLSSLPPLEECARTVSNCWSVGVRDVDCLDSALCCFDGCANRCQGRGPIQGNGLPRLDTVGSQGSKAGVGAVTQIQDTNLGSSINQEDRIVFPQSQTPQVFTPEVPPLSSSVQEVPQPSVTVPYIPYTSEQEEVHLGNTDSAPTKFNKIFGSQTKTSDDSTPQFQEITPIQSEASLSQPQIQTQPQPQQPPQQQPPTLGSILNPPGSSGAFTQCPSAMKCVEKIYCDYNGVMREDVQTLTREQEQLRVPLIPCVNKLRSGAVDTCCRDPNYKDPWPGSEQGQFDDGQYRGEGSSPVSAGGEGSLSVGETVVGTPQVKNSRPSYG